MKKFSIIMPAYNVAEYIENSILSVLNQTSKNYELIIVEDCSTDHGKTLEKINQFKENIHFIQNAHNLGLGGARNEGIKVAQGEYLLFLDSDDILYDNTILSKLDTLISDETPDIVYLGFNMVGSRNFVFLPNEQNCAREYKLAEDKYTNAWSKCWNRQFILNNSIFFPQNVIYEDVPFVFHAISKANSYKIANFITHTYTSGRQGSNASKNQFKQVRDSVTCIENLSNLANVISPEDIPLLKARIKQQKNRLLARLDRVLTDRNLIDNKLIDSQLTL